MIIAGTGPTPTPRFLAARPQAACGDHFEPQDTKAMLDNLEMLKNLKDIQRALGKGTAVADQRLQAAQANLKLAQEPPREFPPGTHQQVAAYLSGGEAPSNLSPEENQRLAQFKKLADQGVQFVEPPLQFYQGDKDGVGFEQSNKLKTTPPECAFMKLIAYKFHAPDNQIHFCTMREGMLSTSTLRAEYLDSLNFFLDQSQAGQTFYKKTAQGHEAIEWASDFVSEYKSDPEAALVKATPGDLVATARALETDGYLPFREARTSPEATRPGVEERNGQVVVGGVLLRKRPVARG